MLTACNENELASTRDSRKFPAPLRSDETAILRFLYEVGVAPSDMTPSWFLSRSLPEVATKSNALCNIWSYYMLGRRFVAPAEASGVVFCCPEPGRRVMKSSRRRALGCRVKSAIARLHPPVARSANQDCLPAGMIGPRAHP